MDRDLELALLEACLALAEAKTPFMSESETLVPVAGYLDSERFERERQVVFRHALTIAAHASELAGPGDFVTRDLVGSPVLLVRDASGRARAFLNVCRHRGATLELQPRGHCRKFVCPYHAWTYRTDGRLSHVRHPEGFPSLDVERTSLRELSCIESGGLLWVCPDPDRSRALDPATEAIAAELDGLCGQGAVFQTHVREWNANWKLLIDGGLESYHFRIAHAATIAGFFTDNTSPYSFVGDHIRSVLPRRSILELPNLPRDRWSLREHSHVLYLLAPNAFVLTQHRHYDLIQMIPLAIDRTLVRIVTVGPPGDWDETMNGYLGANHEFTLRTLAEDFELAEQIQRGMASGANEHFRFARFEGALTEWHRRLDARLAE